MENLLNERLGWPGKMIAFSKSGYKDANPNNLVVFNSNVCTDEGKIWWGDIDLTLSKEDLIAVAMESGKTVYVLYEMDGRFENEDSPKIEKAVVKFLPDGSFELNETLKPYYTF